MHTHQAAAVPHTHKAHPSPRQLPVQLNSSSIRQGTGCLVKHSQSWPVQQHPCKGEPLQLPRRQHIPPGLVPAVQAQGVGSQEVAEPHAVQDRC